MGNYGIPLDKAELLGVLLEAILYGFSLLMFVGSIWSLLSRRTTNPVNHGMFLVAILLLLLSTAHIIVHIIRVMSGLILYRDTYPGGPVGYFANVAEWTFYIKNRIYIVQTLLGDAVIIFRCYMIWQSKLVTMFPALLWCAAAVTGFVATAIEENSPQHYVFVGSLEKWVMAFWSMALSTTVLATVLLIFRIWNIDRKVKKQGIHHPSQLRQVLRITIDAGAIYSFTCLVGMICFISQSSGQYVVLDMITPLIAMMFYMVIIRVGLIAYDGHGSRAPFASAEANPSLDRKRKMQVRITTLTESKTDRYRHPSLYEREPIDIVNNASMGEIRLDRKDEEEVDV